MMADITTQRIGTLATVEAEPFTAAYLTWLQGKPDNMRRSYRRAISDLFDTIDKDSPANILQLDLAPGNVAADHRLAGAEKDEYHRTGTTPWSDFSPGLSRTGLAVGRSVGGGIHP